MYPSPVTDLLQAGDSSGLWLCPLASALSSPTTDLEGAA